MADHPNPHSPGPAPIEPKKPLSGQDQNFLGQPPIVETDKGSRDPKRPPIGATRTTSWRIPAKAAISSRRRVWNVNCPRTAECTT